MRLCSEKNLSHNWTYDGRSISQNVASLNILVHDMINLYYKVVNLSDLFQFRERHLILEIIIQLTNYNRTIFCPSVSIWHK